MPVYGEILYCFSAGGAYRLRIISLDSRKGYTERSAVSDKKVARVYLHLEHRKH